ncbi:related to monophenol monooxygenase precursor (tyrosinase precursor) [Phialocephala subalpina]|uniref:Related to monophenol monooxygenase (Tyrosinase) n=1 Tax=Phialocephala subalpina TaxID=576137 RepID=A0A1L7X762_9HELO|nr:related to monophenol monooxygenase precursor (tyrosinase precursor) [Phialocephala subalpina]
MFSRLVLAWSLVAAFCLVTTAPTPGNSSQPYAITGVRTGLMRRQSSTNWPARRALNDLIHDVPQWPVEHPSFLLLSLFVQAYNKFQQQDESFFLSYHEIAGIHGRPYYSWNYAPQGNGAPTTGYCTHGSVLFLSWHRPYLALYEQVIASFAQDVVKTYPASMQATWQIAADQLRIPFWDWASNYTLPDIAEQSTTQIMNSSGKYQTVNNPLYQYKFQNMPMNAQYFPTTDSDGWLAKYPQTMRGVSVQGGPSNPGLSNYYMAYYKFKSATWYALTRSAGLFNNFSTTAYSGTSLESVHNNVHVAIGANAGHMSLLAYAAYDPIFWLHHANVDRLYAIWQALNPNSFVVPTTEPFGTFALAQGTQEDETTPLEPFASSGDAPYYTSDTSRLPSVFGYTYPEMLDWNIPTAQLTANVAATIHTLYNPNNQLTKRAAGSTALVRKEWFAGVKVNKFDLQGTRFSIQLFLGHVPQNPEEWLNSGNNIGSFTIFPPPNPSGGPIPEVLAYSEYSLVEALTEKGPNMEDVGAVTEYLKEDLHWRVQKFDGTIVPTNQVPSLVITVQSETVTMGKDNTELPSYSDVTIAASATEGKAGGFAG